jgi:DNA-binding transcriptional MerR regulator
MSKLKQVQLAFDFSEPVEAELPVVNEPEIVFVADIKEEKLEIIVEEEVGVMVEEVVTNKVEEVFEKQKSTRGRKSLKEMENEADLIELPDDATLHKKLYYTMSEVTKMFKVNHSLIRFWETEFDILKPRKNKKGDRLFKPEDIKNLEVIYHLLRVKKFTIVGAKDYMKNQKKHLVQFEAIQKLEKLKAFLLEIKAGLQN